MFNDNNNEIIKYGTYLTKEHFYRDNTVLAKRIIFSFQEIKTHFFKAFFGRCNRNWMAKSYAKHFFTFSSKNILLGWLVKQLGNNFWQIFFIPLLPNSSIPNKYCSASFFGRFKLNMLYNVFISRKTFLTFDVKKMSVLFANGLLLDSLKN